MFAFVKDTSNTQNMTNTILCTIDLSESSQHVVQWAVVMAQQLKTHLTILYTYRLIQPQSGEVILLKKNIEETAIQNFKVIESEQLIGKGISYDFRTEI